MPRSHRYHPYKHVSGRALSAVHSGQTKQRARAARAVWHSAIGMEVDSATQHANKRARGEAQMIPGLNTLEWGFPNSIITKLRYTDMYSFASTSGGVSKAVWRANGIFDPDYTNVGHQPMYRDTYAGIYDYYTVLGSKITAVYCSESATVGALCGLIGQDSPTLSSTVTTLSENNNAITCLAGSVNAGPVSLSLTYSPEEQLGSTVKDDNSTMTAVGSDPSGGEGQYYYGVWFVPANGTETMKCTIRIHIEYTVKFTYLSKQIEN